MLGQQRRRRRRRRRPDASAARPSGLYTDNTSTCHMWCLMIGAAPTPRLTAFAHIVGAAHACGHGMDPVRLRPVMMGPALRRLQLRTA